VNHYNAKQLKKISKLYAFNCLKRETFSFLAYGTLREGDYNHNYYGAGLKSTNKKSFVDNSSLWTHGPYPYLLKEEFQIRQVLVEEIEFTKQSTAFEIIEMEIASGYQLGLIEKKLIFFWPDNSQTLSAFLNRPVIEISSGDWFDYHSTTSF
jgi:gamma-glutamylcyclotransferase (GGCT)/AIG2-like uncharacterized protein YtfP